MEANFDKHEIDYIKVYQDKGFTANFYFQDHQLINTESKNQYSPGDLYIVAEHRYEGMSNPSDLSILYVIKTNQDEKGTFLAGYGPSSDLELASFFKDIPKENISQEENINTNK